MRLGIATALLCSGSLGLGCAGADDHRFRAPEHATWGDGSTQDETPTLDLDPRNRTLFQGPDGAYEAYRDERGRTVVPQRPITEPVRRRPPPVGPRNVHFRGAPLDAAFRMLAEAGQFNLLIEGELKKPVSGELEAVDPYEALVALAQVHGARVQFDGSIVVVTAASTSAHPPATP